jgi:hypothetical protein
MEANRGKYQVLNSNTKCRIIVVYKQINTKKNIIHGNRSFHSIWGKARNDNSV